MIKFKSHLYFEEKDRLQENLKSLKELPGSKITFFKNGESLGDAFTDIYMVILSFDIFSILLIVELLLTRNVKCLKYSCKLLLGRLYT